jgi:hypothetical protein
MKRRTFIKGGFAVAVSAALPAGDGVVLDSTAHPYNYTTHDMGFAISREALEESYVDIGARMHAALARSMMQTKENVAARVFWDFEREFLHVEGVTPEEFYKDD